MSKVLYIVLTGPDPPSNFTGEVYRWLVGGTYKAEVLALLLVCEVQRVRESAGGNIGSASTSTATTRDNKKKRRKKFIS